MFLFGFISVLLLSPTILTCFCDFGVIGDGRQLEVTIAGIAGTVYTERK